MQSPSSCGRKVTEAVIWRKMDWISDWISASVLSAGGGGSAVSEEGVGFSLSVGLELREDLVDLEGFEKIWTCDGLSIRC